MLLYEGTRNLWNARPIENRISAPFNCAWPSSSKSPRPTGSHIEGDERFILDDQEAPSGKSTDCVLALDVCLQVTVASSISGSDDTSS